MKKLFALLLVFVMSVLVLSSCSNEPDTIIENPVQNEDPIVQKVAEVTRVSALKGPTGMGMAKMITDADQKYVFNIAPAPTDVQAALISGTVDIAAVPTNLASVLYNKTEGGIKVLALNTEGVLYILDSTGKIEDIDDLKGKTIGATGQGSTPEYILRYILTENGIDPDKDVTLEFYTEHAELATRMASGDVKIGMLPEPNVTTTITKNTALKNVINLTEEWSKIAPDSALVQGCIVARTEFIEKYPDSVENFLDEYKASVDYVLTNEDAPEMIAALGIVPSAQIAEKALPNCNICYFDASSQMYEKLSGFLGVLNSFSPQSIGGTLPDDTFYYGK